MSDEEPELLSEWEKATTQKIASLQNDHTIIMKALNEITASMTELKQILKEIKAYVKIIG